MILDLIAGDRAMAEKDLAEYDALGGKDLTLPSAAGSTGQTMETIMIPGPYRSFARMAALSPAAGPAGYSSGSGSERGNQRLPGLARQRPA